MENESHHRPEPVYTDSPEYPPFSGQRFPINAKTLSIFFGLFAATVFTTWLVGGPWFSFGLILILATHEFGHYWACRVNNVNATLPNFIPLPPIPFFLNIGTMGAFIMIKEPTPNRRTLMEIGASGPIAGFIVAVPILLIGLLNSHITLEQNVDPMTSIRLGDSLIFLGMVKVTLGINPFSIEETVMLHPLAFAGWLGMFFTALNLLPMGQLDGGHVIYSLFNSKHAYVARLSFLALLLLGFHWAGWWVWAALVFLLGLKHPPVLNELEPLEPRHRFIGYLSIVIFILTFVPVPFGLIQ
ncbi:MAG: site-2 protease family protein [Nitrospina sp.]|nr:MAG: site-2 protease family protein [Nitrospina sp.]TDJ59476.1 MAG: site-2 protease family protein [Nitrospina sp.]